MNLLFTLGSRIRERGFRETFCRAWNSLVERLKFRWVLHDPFLARRYALSAQLTSLHRNVVQHGPFARLRLPPESWWGLSDRGAIILGIYEQEVLQSLQDKPPHCRTFIDLGAADGYYGIGALVNNLFDHSFCYEESPAGQQVIRASSELNGCAQRVTIRGRADERFLGDFNPALLAESFLLMDIEGAEFDFLDRPALEFLRRTIVVVEIHDRLVEDGQHRLERLVSDAAHTHRITWLTTGARDLSPFPELATWSDTDRWLLCSEGRRQRMSWMRLDPVAP